MSETRQQTSAVAYIRVITDDAPLSIKDADGTYPRRLRDMLRDAAKTPRPFDAVVVGTAAVLGTEEEAREIVTELGRYGVDVVTTDGSYLGGATS